MFAFFGSNNRHGTPHHETIKWFQSEAYCRIHVYEKPTGITGWLLGLAAFRELLAKLLCTKRKSASAPRCLRCLGATIDIVNSITRTANRSGQGVFSHRCLRKANTEDTVITGLGGLPGITAPGRGPGAGHCPGAGAGQRSARSGRGLRTDRSQCRAAALAGGSRAGPHALCGAAAGVGGRTAGAGPGADGPWAG